MERLASLVTRGLANAAAGDCVGLIAAARPRAPERGREREIQRTDRLSASMMSERCRSGVTRMGGMEARIPGGGSRGTRGSDDGDDEPR